MERTRCYRGDQLVAEGFPLADISALLAEPDAVVWCDLCGPDPAQLSLIYRELGLHELAVEDVLDAGQRPKLDHYANHLFIATHAVDVDPETLTLTAHEVGVFVTRHAMVTVHADPGFDIDAVVAMWDASDQRVGSRVAFLLHGLLDYVVDTQYTAAERLDDAIDELEGLLFDGDGDDARLQRGTFAARKALVQLRRLALPMREVVNSVMRRDLGVVDAESSPYFQDVYDHVIRVGEWTESLRDLLANILETRLTVRGNQLNVIMKKVTSWAAIIAVPTAVTGFYGQNIPYPGYGQPAGFWVSAVLILIISGALYLIFRSKDWL